MELHDSSNTAVTFEWDPPNGSGPEAVVDYYIISISPAPLSHPERNVVHSLLWNVTLAHNTYYKINITAVNCAGPGETFIFSDIEYSKFSLPSTRYRS